MIAPDVIIQPPVNSQSGNFARRQIRENVMAGLLMAEDFRPHIGKAFRVAGGRHSLTLSEVEARDLSEAERRNVPRPPFNLIFSGPPGEVLAEGIYTLEVDGGPAFELYVMPIHTPARDYQNYQAAFN
jgi:hypothetical protein